MKPYYSDAWVTLYHGKCEDVLPSLAPVDAVITDPPYSEHTHNKVRRNFQTMPDQHPRNFDLGFGALTPDLMRFCAGQFARLARRWVLTFSDMESDHLWRRRLKRAGMDYVRTGVWIREAATPQFSGDRPAAGAEAITIMHPPGRKRWNGGGSHAVWSYPIVNNVREPRIHTTQKPLPLMERLVDLFTDPGETILDAFAGSSTTLRAAKNLGRKAVGVEMSEEYCEVSARRLDGQQGNIFGVGEVPVASRPQQTSIFG